MEFTLIRMLFIGILALSIIFFLKGKSFVPTACYFLIMAAIIEVMIQYKLKKIEIQKLKSEQADWIHKELNQACESNDIEELKKTLHSLDSKLYLLTDSDKNFKEEPKQSPKEIGSDRHFKKNKLPDNYLYHAWPENEKKLDEAKREKIQKAYSIGLSQDYFIQEYRRYLQDMVLFGKLKIDEIPQKLRVNGGRSFYAISRRFARDFKDCERYVLSCQIQLDDMSSVYLSDQEREMFVKDIWDAMWIGIDYFEEEKEFNDFLEEQKENYPGDYSDFESQHRKYKAKI